MYSIIQGVYQKKKNLRSQQIKWGQGHVWGILRPKTQANYSSKKKDTSKFNPYLFIKKKKINPHFRQVILQSNQVPPLKKKI